MTTYETKYETDYGTFKVAITNKGAVRYKTFSYDGKYGSITCNTLNGLVLGLTNAGCIVPISDMRVLLDLGY
jgi:hypothetical protein